MKVTNLGGSFMIRANIDNCLDGTDLLQMEEPTWGDLHYNLYRSCNNGSYEKIMQFPYPGVWCHVNYFDTINDFGYSCYNYKVTMTGLTSDGILCESTPAPNLHNPLIDWVEVCDTWGIEEIAEDEHLVLYPNPTTGLLTIIMDDFSNAEVYDLMGHLMKRSKDTTLDLSGLAKGVYLLRIIDEEGKSHVARVVVKE